MSFRGLLDRTVTLIPREVTGTDARGNDIVEDGTPIPDVKTRRDISSNDEETQDEDRQTLRYLYFFEATVTLTGYDRIVDTDGTYEVDGPPIEVSNRRGVDHLEVFAFLITGAGGVT